MGINELLNFQSCITHDQRILQSQTNDCMKHIGPKNHFPGNRPKWKKNNGYMAQWKRDFSYKKAFLPIFIRLFTVFSWLKTAISTF